MEKRKKMVDLSAVFWFLLIVSCAVSAPACIDSSGYFIANGPYDSNLRSMLSSLPSRVTANEGFYKTPFGRDPNIAYGLGMCSRGITTQACSDCIKTVSNTLLQTCPNQIKAIDWSNRDSPCLVRYSNNLIFGQPDEELMWREYTEYRDIKANLIDFNTNWHTLMNRAINKVDMSLYANSTQELDLYPFPHIYAIAQCSNDLTQSNCTACLRNLLNNNSSCCLGIQGGFIARTSCFMQWDLRPFPGLSGNVILPTPPSGLPDGHANNTKKDIKI